MMRINGKNFSSDNASTIRIIMDINDDHDDKTEASLISPTCTFCSDMNHRAMWSFPFISFSLCSYADRIL